MKVGQWSDFSPLLEDAKSAGLKVTLHIAEVPNYEETEVVHLCSHHQAMLKFLPDRIGHACCLVSTSIHSQQTPELEERILTKRIPLELCLTSNVKTKSVPSFNAHHFRTYYQFAHPVILCVNSIVC